MEQARGFHGSRTKIQWVTHEASVEHAPGLSGVGGAVGGGGVLEPPTFSENPGEFSSPPQNPGGEFWENLHHQTASFAGAPITTGEEAGSESRDSAACED